MAKAKTGLSFYSMDSDRFQDIRIKRLKKDCGCDGFAVYEYILNEIYRVRGCVLVWDESTAFDVAEYWGLKETKVNEIVRYCCAVGLFSKELLSNGSVLTSPSIQSRYIDMCIRAKRKGIIIPEEYDIIPEESRKILEEYRKTQEDCRKVKNSKVKETLSIEREKKSEPSGSFSHPDHPGFHPEKVDKPLDECKAFVCADSAWLEIIHRQQYIGMNEIHAYLEEFFRELSCRNVKMKSPEDAESHFASWLSIKLENVRKNAGNRRNHTSTGSKHYGEP